MIEVERKYRVSSAFADHLARELGADAPARQVDQVYLLAADSWDTFVEGSPVLRLRMCDGAVSMAVKTRGEHGTREEELSVDDLATAQAWVKQLGATEVTLVDKIRRTAVRDGFTITIDQVTRLGDFVEIERLVDREADAPSVLQMIDAYAQGLGLSLADVEERKYDTLLAELSTEGHLV